MTRFHYYLFTLGVLVCSLFFGWGATVYAQSCPELISDGGPYELAEGNSLQFNAEVAPSDPPLQRFQWGIGPCRLGNGTGLVADRQGEQGIQHCLIDQFGSDGANQLYTDGIHYRADNGSCLITGTVNFQLLNTPPTVDILTTCDEPLSGELPIEIHASDPAEFDHGLPALLVGSTPDDSIPLGETLINTGGTATIIVDTTDLPDSDTVTFEVTVEDDESTSSALLPGCTVDNDPPTLPPADLTVNQGSDLVIDLDEATDPGAGIDTFEVAYQGDTIASADGDEMHLIVDRFALISAGVDQCDDNNTFIETELDVTAIDEIGRSTTTRFPLLINCDTSDEQEDKQDQPEDDNEEDETGGGEETDDAPSSSIDISRSLSDEPERDRQITTIPDLPSFVPNFEQLPAERINEYITFCQALPNSCPHGRSGSPVSSFPDIQQHWSQGYVDAFRATCGVKGKGDTRRFYPDDLVINGEAVKMGVTAIPFGNVYQHGGETDYQGPTYFPDVPAQERSAPYWTYAQQNSWLDGIATRGEPVDPYQPMPRSKAIRLLMNIYADSAQIDLQQFETDAFDDISPTHPDYHHIAAAHQLNVVQGKQVDGQRLFDPAAGVTRAEFSKMATQLFTPFFNWCGVTSNLSRLQDTINQRDELDEEEQQEAFDQIKNKIATTRAQDLEQQGVAQGGLAYTFTTVTQSKTNDLLGEVNEVLNEMATVAEGEPCPPELVAKLKTFKEQLEEQAEQLTEKANEQSEKCDDLQKELDELNKEVDDLEQEKEKQDKKVDDTQKKLDNIDKQLNEKKQRVDELQDILTNDNNVTEHKGDKPLEKVEAGAAMSFDGGESWIVVHGESGVDSYLEASDQNEDVMDELRQLEGEIRDLNQQKEDTKEELKEAKEKQEEINNELKQKKQERDQKQQELKACTKKLKEISQQIAELNAKIDAFNKKAKECGLKAKRAYDEAQDKLDKMPPDDREEAEEEYEDEVTDEEENATDNPDEDIEEGGSGLGGAAKKLEEAMRTASACPPPQTKQGDWTRVEGSYNEETLHGADKVELVNAQGTRGLDDKTTKEVFGGIMEGLNFISPLSSSMSRLDFLSDANPVGLIYGEFQSAAQKAITDKLKEWMENRTLQGIPQRVEVSIGPIWSLDIRGREEKQPVYQCVDGIWQLEHHNTRTITETSECKYHGGPYTHKKQFDIMDLPGSCTMGSCQQGREAAIKQAIQSAKQQHANGGILGPCTNVANLLTN